MEQVKVSIRSHGKEIWVQCDNDATRLYIQTFLTVREEIRKGRDKTWKAHAMFRTVGRQTLVTSVSYFEYLAVKLWKMGVQVDSDVNPAGHITLLPKWREILAANPKNPEQLAVTEQFLRFAWGIASLYTGFGKTEMLLAAAESYITQFPAGRVLILAPGLQVMEGILLRFKRWGIAHLVSTRIEDIADTPIIVNALSSLPRTDAFKSGQLDPYLDQVTMVITDECHQDGTQHILRRAKNVTYRYGFSATPNVHTDFMTMEPGEDFNRYAFETVKIIDNFGPVRVRRIPKHKKVTEVLVTGTFAPFQMTANDDLLREVDCLRASLLTSKFGGMLKHLMTRFANGVFYLPLPVKDIGQNLYRHLTQDPLYRDAVIYWDAKTIWPDTLKSLADITDTMMAADSKVRLLISTQVGIQGIDIPAINGCILTNGKNIKMTLQPIGRSARADELIVVNVIDRHNPIMYAQFRKRRHTLHKNYQVVNEIKIDN